MLTASFAFAVLCFALLLLFFAALPSLKTCELPFLPTEPFPEDRSLAALSTESRISRSGIRERIAVLVVTVVYAVCAFWNLGNTDSPQTFADMSGRAAVYRLTDERTPSQMVLFPGVGQGSYSVEYSNDAEGWHPLTEFTQDHVAVLKWQYLPLELPEGTRYLRIQCTSGNPWLGELQLRDPYGEAIPAAGSISELSDEQGLVPASSDYLNSSYFDEIYHARTAWEQMHGIWPYEISHPPLGKEILSIGILLFGMTPFGWRFSGTMIGVLMLPVMYVFLKRLFGPGRTPVLGTILLASGFMHYVQTRIATIDSYAVFFILLMYLFMLGWLREEKLSDLALSGIAFGLGAAAKWTCLYAGAGLAVLWAGHWILSFPEHKDTFLRFLKNALFCILFFVLVPCLIYYISYLPYGQSQNARIFSREYTKLVLDNQSFMFSYHSNIKAEHPYSSRWYQWVLDIRPILYYLEYLPGGRRVSIAAFVNPMICWGGLLSLPVLCYTAAIRRDRTAAFILVGYASGLVPWMFISRLTFAYHYFASAVFLIPALCYVFRLMDPYPASQRPARYRLYPVLFTAVCVLLFAVFFPVLCGLPVNNDLATRVLGWLPSWPI